MNAQEIKRPRGRPRPAETVERDRRILAYLAKGGPDGGPKSRNQIAEDLGLDKTIVYLSLARLRRKDLVCTCSDTAGPGTLWSADVNQCP